MTRILLAIDFSPNAWNALCYALKLFKKKQCVFYVLHAVQVSPSNLSNTINKERNTRIYEVSVKEGEHKLKRWMQQIEASKENPRHHFKSMLVFDSLLNAVGQTINKKNIDYVCMGTQGSSALKEIFMGSNTVNIIKHIDFCPIIAVPENYEYKNPDQICFATNFKRPFERSELYPLISIVELWNAALKIIHVKQADQLDETQQRHLKFLKAEIRRSEYIIEEVSETRNIASAITKIINSTKVSMLAMVHNRHGFLSKLIREPVIKRLAFQCEVPFLVLPEVV